MIGLKRCRHQDILLNIQIPVEPKEVTVEEYRHGCVDFSYNVRTDGLDGRLDEWISIKV